MNPFKLIYFHPKAPAYELYNDAPRPAINWDTPDGNWVGIWGYEWGDQLGNKVIDYTQDITFEVWQPDLRADKVYEHRFENGLLHKLYPAKLERHMNQPVISSALALEHLKEEEKNHTLILQTEVNANLDWLVRPNRHLPILGTYHGTIQLPYQQVFKLRKNLKRYVQLMREHFAMKEVVGNYSMVTYQNNTNLEGFKNMFKGPMHKITMGVDFNLFKPMDKTESRRALGLPVDKPILLTVGRLNPLKQNDKVIEALINGSADSDFHLVIVGSPNEERYLQNLKQLAEPLLKKGQITFPGYKLGAELIQYYNAADLFVMSSTSEGCSVASMEAIACGTPVFSTATGYISELLKEHGKGYVTGIRDYHDWARAFNGFLTGTIDIPAFDRATAEGDFSWPAVARKFDNAYRQLLSHEQ